MFSPIFPGEYSALFHVVCSDTTLKPVSHVYVELVHSILKHEPGLTCMFQIAIDAIGKAIDLPIHVEREV